MQSLHFHYPVDDVVVTLAGNASDQGVARMDADEVSQVSNHLVTSFICH
jgi:hypothetical protein